MNEWWMSKLIRNDKKIRINKWMSRWISDNRSKEWKDEWVS